jgi:Na+/H+ antiporter NhaB
MYGCGPLKLEPYAKDDKYILYRSAVNAPCCPLTPGKILIIECVVALLTAVNGGKVLLKVMILFLLIFTYFYVFSALRYLVFTKLKNHYPLVLVNTPLLFSLVLIEKEQEKL